MTALIRQRSGFLSAMSGPSLGATAPSKARSRLDSTVGQVDATGAVRGDGTCLRCGGCGASATLAARERHYGQLVYGFVDRHESCGGAVTLSGSRGNHG
jgi:hypothetical protein